MSMMEPSGLLKLTELGVNMQHKICDACETVAHCANHGCIPLQPYQAAPKNTATIKKFSELLDQTPRLSAWAAIGPVQRSELEQFAEAILNTRAVGVTADGFFVEPGNRVWIISSTGAPKPTTVQKTQAVTNYELFGPVPVAHSWMDRQALERYQRDA